MGASRQLSLAVKWLTSLMTFAHPPLSLLLHRRHYCISIRSAKRLGSPAGEQVTDLSGLSRHYSLPNPYSQPDRWG